MRAFFVIIPVSFYISELYSGIIPAVMNETSSVEKTDTGGKKSFYQRHIRKHLPLISFAAGFMWQSMTLDRIDNLWINILLLLDILLLGLLITWFNLARHGKLRNERLINFAGWYPIAIQFLLGGLFSSYVIFYFQSATMTQGPVFILLLVILLIITQFFEQQLSSLAMQAAMYFMAAFSFFTFFFPVIIGRMNAFIFLFGGLVSIILIMVLLTYLRYREASGKPGTYFRVAGIIIVLFIGVNVLYMFNLIPPVPLSVRHGGIYHRVVKRDDHYTLVYEKKPWYNFWETSDPVIHYHPGDTVFCYVSVFAPTMLQEKIFHNWESYDPIDKKWKSQDRIGYAISGGRYGGYRGYTYKYRIFPGRWRVDVRTASGQLLGRIPFHLVQISDSIDYRRLTR